MGKAGKCVLLIAFSVMVVSLGAAGHNSCSTSGVSDDTNMQNEGIAGAVGWQVWSAKFDYGSRRGGRSGCGDVNADTMHVSDGEGNSGQISNPGYSYNLTTNEFSWLNGGDMVSVYFSKDGYTSSTVTDQMPNPISFSNPEPAKSTSTGEIGTSSPELSVDVSNPAGGGVDVSFYNASNNNQIGATQTGVTDGETVSFEWSGLQDGNTYNWYVEACKSGCTNSKTYEFDVNGFPEITSISFTNSSVAHSFNAKITVEDSNGDSDLDSCDATATGGGTSMNYNNLGFEGVDGDNTATCDVQIRYDDPSTNWAHLESLNLDFTVSDSKNAETASYSNSFPNNKPRVKDIKFSDYSNQHRFNVSAKIEADTDTINELNSCEVTVDDYDTHVYTKSAELDTSFGPPGVASCNYSNINDTAFGGFEYGENLNVTINSTDQHSEFGLNHTEHKIPNNAPTTLSNEPEDGGIAIGEPILLNVTVYDSDSDSLTTWFLNEADDSVIDVQSSLSGQKVSGNLPNIRVGEDYTWYAKIGDGATNYTTPYYGFTKAVSSAFRIRTLIDYRYSDIITSPSSSKDVFFEVRNRVPGTKTLTTYIEGDVRADFADGSTEKTYTVDGKSREEFIIRVKPDSTGEKELKLVTKNEDLDFNTSTSIDVKSKRFTTNRGVELPGVQFIHLLVLSIAGIAAYYLQI